MEAGESDTIAVNGTVSRIAQFGVFLETDYGLVLVHMAEQSWTWPYRNSRHLRVGDLRQVLIRPEEAKGDSIRGSFRQLVLPPSGRVGDRLAAKIEIVDETGVTLRVGEGSFVDFSKSDMSAAGVTASCFVQESVVSLVIDHIQDGSIFLRFPREFEAVLGRTKGIL